MIIDEETYSKHSDMLLMNDEQINDFLEHFGIRGMKWGVRRQRRLAAIQRGAKRGGPVVSKLRTAAGPLVGFGGHLGPIDLIKGRGVSGGLQRKATRLKGQLTRHDQGKSTAMDILKRYAFMRPQDLIPVRTKNVKKKTSVKSDYVIATAAGAIAVASFLARHSQKKAASLAGM